MDQEGIALWRRIGEAIVDEIDSGVLGPGDRLPASQDLAARFGVNRHTILRAISQLQDDGLVRIERGRGTYVVDNIIQYRMGAKTRFEENLLNLNYVPARELVTLIDLPATKAVAAALDVAEGETVTLVSLVGEANDVPISYSHNYFPTRRLPGIAGAFRKSAESPKQHRSITAALAEVGIVDFSRKLVRVRSRGAQQDEAKTLRIPQTESLLELEVTNVDPAGVPVMYALTCFPSSRVEFVLEP